MKSVISGHQKGRPKLVFKTNYRLMQVENIALDHFAILHTFIELQFVVKIFVLSILSGHFIQVLLYSDFKVCLCLSLI